MEEEASSRRPTSSRSKSDQDRRVRFQDVTDEPEDLSTAGHDDNNVPPDEGPGAESDDETRDAHTQSSAICPTSRSKQATVHGTAQCSPDVSFDLQANSTVRAGGNMYSHVRVSNDARLHLGDSITINNYHRDSKEVDAEHVVARVEITQEFLMTLSAAVGLVRALLQTTTGLFVLLQVVMSGYRLPKQIGDKMAVFEDALGRCQRIDLLFINDWPAFKQRLECDFQAKPGSRRILTMNYRLFDRLRGDYLVDPRNPPPYTSVFRQGRHVQMSIHFEWNEVSDEQCPKCGLPQDCIVDAETVCARCKFTYRGQVESSRAEEVDDDGISLQGNHRDVRNTARPRTYGQNQDKPAYFSRITISRKPMSACLYCSASYSRTQDRCHVCNRIQARDRPSEQRLGKPFDVQKKRNRRKIPGLEKVDFAERRARIQLAISQSLEENKSQGEMNKSSSQSRHSSAREVPQAESGAANDEMTSEADERRSEVPDRETSIPNVQEEVDDRNERLEPFPSFYTSPGRQYDGFERDPVEKAPQDHRPLRARSNADLTRPRPHVSFAAPASAHHERPVFETAE
jgi:hypothetical protein